MLSVLTLLFWDFVRDTIVVPIDYLVWVSGLVLRSIPQELYLALLLLISLALSVNTVERIRSKQATGIYEPSRPQGESRYHRWLLLVSKQSASPFYRDIFVSEARNLILSMLAYDHGIDSAEAETRVRNGTLAVPERIKRFDRDAEYPDLPPLTEPHPSCPTAVADSEGRSFSRPAT